MVDNKYNAAIGVVPLSQVQDIDDYFWIIPTYERDLNEEICGLLTSKCSDVDFLNIVIKNYHLYQEGYLPHLGILLTTACNLNCKYCADLCNYRPNLWYDFSLLNNDLNKVLSSVDRIGEVLIGGGETLLYRRLEEVIDLCVSSDKIDEVIVVTNGTMMPNEKTWDSLCNEKCLLRISGYENGVAPERDDLIDKARKKHIRIDDLAGMKWYNVGNNQKRNRTKLELESVFKECGMKTCVTLNATGNIFYCSRAMAAYDTNLYPRLNEHEYVNVRDSDGNLTERLERFYNLKYISTCDYCDGISDKSHVVPVAEQICSKNELIGCLDELNGLYLQGREDNEYETIMNEFINKTTGYCFFSADHKQKQLESGINVIYLSGNIDDTNACYVADENLLQKLVNNVILY